MKALVTGGTGFVGSHVIEQLLAKGDSVRAIARSDTGHDFLRSLGAEPVAGDLDDAVSLRRACEGCEIVYHAAARVDIVGSEEEFHRTTVAGTQHLIQAARNAGVRRIVHVSSCGVYHPRLLAKGVILDEATPTSEPPKWFAYGRAKYHAEQVIQRDCPPRLEWVIVRLGYVYGPRNRTMRSYLEPVMRDSIMMIVGKGDNEMALIYVEDVARAIALAGHCPRATGRILVAGPTQPVTQKEYFYALADGFGVPRPKYNVVYAVAYFFGWLGERFAKRPPRNMVMRRSAIVLTGLPQRLRCKATRELLGWQPQVQFADGIRRAFDWYHREYGPPSQ